MVSLLSRGSTDTCPSLCLAGGAGQNVSVPKAPRSPLSGIPVRTAPAAAVSPMQVSEPQAARGAGGWPATRDARGAGEKWKPVGLFSRHIAHFSE